MASNVSICNLALTMLRADRITALTDNTENARRLTAIYDSCLEDVLRAHPWNFAIKRSQLARLASTPIFGYEYEFQLPGDCLRPLEINDGTALITDYKIEGRKVLCSYDTAYMKYITNVTDPNQYTSQFRFVLSTRLAAELVGAITGKVETIKPMFDLYYLRLQTAKETDAQESDSTNVIGADEWTIEKRI